MFVDDSATEGSSQIEAQEPLADASNVDSMKKKEQIKNSTKATLYASCTRESSVYAACVSIIWSRRSISLILKWFR